MANNSLQSLPSSLLTAQGSQLQRLDLSGNRLTSDDIRPSLLNGLTGLLELDLSQNLLDKLRKKTLYDLTSLETLNLSDNMIKEIPPKLFKNQRLLTRDLYTKELLTAKLDEVTSPPAVIQAAYFCSERRAAHAQ